MLRSRAIIAIIVVIAAGLLAAAFLITPGERRATGGEPAMDTRDRAPATVEPGLGAGGATMKDADAPSVARAAEEAALFADEQGGGSSATMTNDQLDAPDIEARIVRNASLALRLKTGGFEDGWSDAQAIAGASGGYVVSASRSGVGDGPRSGMITMRVPSDRFDKAVDRMRDLVGAQVERLDVSSQDVTQEFVDVRSRLKHDRAVEGRLLALLAQTDGVSEVLAVQSRLDQVQEQIEISRGRLQYLEKMTEMSTIEVTLREPGAAAKDDEDGESVLGEAWEDARERFAENIGAAIVWTGGALPGLVLLAVIGLVARVAWRRSTARTSTVEQREPTA